MPRRATGDMSLVADTGSQPPAKPTFPCSACGAQYSRLEYLRRHERKHNEDRPFACNDCAKSFARSDVLLRHRRRCHPDSVASDAANAAIAAAANAAPSGSAPVVPRIKAKDAKKAVAATRARRGTNATSNSGDGSASSPDVNNPTTPPSESPDTPANPNGLPDSFARNESGIGSVPALSMFDLTPQWPAMNGAPLQLSSQYSTANYPADILTSSTQSTSLLPLVPSPLSVELNSIAGCDLANSLTNGWSPNGMTPPSASSTSVNSLSPSDSFVVEPLLFDDPLVHIGHVQTTFGKWYTFPSDPPASPRIAPTLESVHDYLGGDQIFSDIGFDIFSPERSLYRAEDMSSLAHARMGSDHLDPSDRFYLPPGVFSGCYTVTHWMLPPIVKLSRIARHSLGVLSSQMPIIHEPTFKLDRVHGWLAFSLSTIGTKNIFSKIYEKQEECPNDPWDLIPSIVRSEKSEMMVKNFMRRSKQMPLKESFAIVQALIIYHLPNFLSSDQADRMTAQTFLATIIQIARQSGLFSPTAEFNIAGIVIGPDQTDLDAKWKNWIQAETIRRTIWLVYVLDTLACLESSLETRVSPRDLRYMPLPAPNCVWAAQSAQEWADTVQSNPAVNLTLDYMMNKTFAIAPPQHSPASYLNNPREAELPITQDCLGTKFKMGPFARMVMILTLLRGLIEFGEGQRKGGVVTQSWAVDPATLDANLDDGIEQRLLATYRRAFDRWRQGWDFDKLCHGPFNKAPDQAQFPSMCSNSFVNDATPYYWLAMVLLDMLPQRIPAEGRAGVFKDGDRDLTQFEEASKNLFHGIDYRTMLGMAKNFAHSGEGI